MVNDPAALVAEVLHVPVEANHLVGAIQAGTEQAGGAAARPESLVVAADLIGAAAQRVMVVRPVAVSKYDAGAHRLCKLGLVALNEQVPQFGIFLMVSKYVYLQRPPFSGILCGRRGAENPAF